MISRRQFGGLGAGALALAACAPRAGGPASGELRFSVLATEGGEMLQRRWAPILADMQTAIGMRVTPVFSADGNALVEAMRLKRTDVGRFSNAAALQAVRGADAEVFARTVDAGGPDGRHSVLIVNAKSELTLERMLTCDQRLAFGAGRLRSTAGTLAPLAYLFAPKGIDPAACFKSVRNEAGGQANLTAVAHGELDVAAIDDRDLTLARQRGDADASAVTVIWTSPLLPEDPILWRKDLPAAVKENVRQFLITYGQGDGQAAQSQHAKLVALGVGGFAPADDDHLLPAREIEAAQAWLTAKQGGDAARIAAARRALDQVRAERQALEDRTAAPAGAQ